MVVVVVVEYRQVAHISQVFRLVVTQQVSNLQLLKFPSIPQLISFLDAPAKDEYLVFDDEGAGSQAGSLSSIEDDFNNATSNGGSGAGGFENLQQYGQKFSNLYTLYNPPEVDNSGGNDPQFRNRGNEYQNSFSNLPQHLQFRN